MDAMTPDELRCVLDCPAISERHKEIIAMRYVDGLPSYKIAWRARVSTASVPGILLQIRNRAARWVPPTPPQVDEAWRQSQIRYVRGLEPGHRTHYLRGIAIAHSQAIADDIDRGAG